jgi:hypothetical protein
MERGFKARLVKTVLNTPMPKDIQIYRIAEQTAFCIRNESGKRLENTCIVYLVTTRGHKQYYRHAIEFKAPMSQTAIQKKLVEAIQQFEKDLAREKAIPVDIDGGSFDRVVYEP